MSSRIVMGEGLFVQVSLGGVVILIETKPTGEIPDAVLGQMFDDFDKLKTWEGPLINGVYVLTFKTTISTEATVLVEQVAEYLHKKTLEYKEQEKREQKDDEGIYTVDL